MLREHIDYDHGTGIFRWRTKPLRGDVGDIATGEDGQGYLRLTICGERHRAHRLAWLYVYGFWPNDLVDHINMDRSDNRIENLRLATKSQNASNSSKRPSNTTGFKGVTRSRGRYVAQIKANGKVRRIGSYETPEEASLVYQVAASLLHGEFARS
jgi:hypothetical protein